MIKKIEGYILTYKPKDNNARVLFHHTLFGRLVRKNYRGRKYAYYNRGELDNIKFQRLENNKIFMVCNEEFIEHLKDLLPIFGEMSFEKNVMEVEESECYTGKEYWTNKARKDNILLRASRKRGRV